MKLTLLAALAAVAASTYVDGRKKGWKSIGRADSQTIKKYVLYAALFRPLRTCVARISFCLLPSRELIARVISHRSYL